MTQLIVKAFDIWRRHRTAKFTKTRKIPRNSVQIFFKYMSVQHIWNFSQLLQLFTCRKLVNLSRNFVTETCKQRPETPKLPGVNYVAKNWALAMMLKALPLAQFWSFWSVLLLKEQMMTSVRKTLKMQVWSAQNQSISNEVFPENQSFLTDWFSAEFAPKIPAKSVHFFANLPLKIPQNLSPFPRPIRSPA